MSDDLLPVNATAQERALAGVTARMSAVPQAVRESWDPDTCPAHLLPWLAWAFSVDKWDASWTEEQKRGAIRNSVFVHRHKGTPAALQSALDALGYPTDVREWHQLVPQQAPYTFGLDVEIVDIGPQDETAFNRIIDVANGAKNVRSHLTFVNMHSTRSGTVYAGGVAICGEIISIPSGD